MGSRIMFNIPFKIETFDDNDKKSDQQDQSIKIVKLQPKYNLHLINIYNMIDEYNTIQWN